LGGVSKGGFASLNLARHTNDLPAAVEQNRSRLIAAQQLPTEPAWLSQVHSATIVRADTMMPSPPADASWATKRGTVCAVLTADCLPVLLCDQSGTQVAAVHAGWRGLVAGVLEQSVERFTAAGIAAGEILAWLGPAICAQHYEVDALVRDEFVNHDEALGAAFQVSRPGHWYCDLYEAARLLLARGGVTAVSGGDYCTFGDERFYSHRQDASSGRQASLIWLAAN